MSGAASFTVCLSAALFAVWLFEGAFHALCWLAGRISRMKMHAVKSSNVAAVGHENGVTRVVFKSGHAYDHDDTPEEFEKLRTAPSVGSHYHATYRGRHRPVPEKKG